MNPNTITLGNAVSQPGETGDLELYTYKIMN